MRHSVLLIAFVLLAPAAAEADHHVDGNVDDNAKNSESPDPLLAERWRFEAGLAFQVGLPQEDFEGDETFGAAFFGGVRFPSIPVMLGLDFGVLIRDGERKTIEETNVSSTTATVSPDIVMLHFVARLQPATGRFRPFMEALVGFKYFETRTRLTEHYDGFGNPNDCTFNNCTSPVKNKKNNSDIALSYGAGLGFDVGIFSSETVRISIVAGARYLIGEKARYVVPSSIRIVDANTVEFETVRTRTDILTTQLGLVAEF